MPEPKKSAQNEGLPNAHFDVRMPRYSLWRRMQIPVIAAAVSTILRILGPTLRYEVLGWQHAERAYAQKRRVIWAFWHCGIIGVLWWGRNRGVVVLHSTNFDGQWIGRVIQRFGFDTALGSSTRGGLRGLAELAQRMKNGRDVGFTIDGPRGPRFVAKPGPIMLARDTGNPVAAFHVGYEHAMTLTSTWDHFQVPRPFSRVVMLFAPMIEVPRDANKEVVAAKQYEMQSELDRCREFAERWFKLSADEKEIERAKWNA
jgi:lysophospholipid acyltransferase (LPLAT)-like uncharacterized protein